MSSFIISLPTSDNDGNSTRHHVNAFLASVQMQHGTYTFIGGGYGIWYGDDGAEYNDEVLVYQINVRPYWARTFACHFGISARQEAVLLVPVKEDRSHLVAVGEGMEAARSFAKAFGGATILRSGHAFSLAYEAVTHRVEYDYEKRLINGGLLGKYEYY